MDVGPETRSDDLLVYDDSTNEPVRVFDSGTRELARDARVIEARERSIGNRLAPPTSRA